MLVHLKIKNKRAATKIKMGLELQWRPIDRLSKLLAINMIENNLEYSFIYLFF